MAENKSQLIGVAVQPSIYNLVDALCRGILKKSMSEYTRDLIVNDLVARGLMNDADLLKVLR